MKKKILIAISIIATITLGTITGCTAYESSSHQEVISDTSISSENEHTSSEDSSSEYIIDSSENDSSETDSSEDESSEVEKVTTKTPKKVEDSSSEDDNSSKVTTTKKTETPKITTTTQPVVTQAPVTQKPATTTKTTTKKPVTQPNGSHTHNWVKYREADGIKYYQCNICGELKEEGKKTTTTTTKTQPTSKTVQPNEWIPVYYKTLVTHTVGDGYEKIIDANGYAKPGKKVEFVSKTYWNEAAANRGDATEIAKRTKAQNEAKAFIDRDDLMNAGWVSSGNDHYINVPDKYNIAFYYYKASNGKYLISAGNKPSQAMNESDLMDLYRSDSTIKSMYKDAYLTGTPWA